MSKFYEYIRTCSAYKRQTYLHHIYTLAKINVKIDECDLPTFYWLPKLHKNPFKSRFISNSSHCSLSFKAYCIRSNGCQRSCYQIQ